MVVTAFPLRRRREVVLDVISGLNLHRGHDAAHFWHEKSAVLFQDLVNDGVAVKEAKEEVRLLLYTALREMKRERKRRDGRSQRG